MPPLTTPATAVLFMIAFFVVMMGVPLLAIWINRHSLAAFCQPGARIPQAT